MSRPLDRMTSAWTDPTGRCRLARTLTGSTGTGWWETDE
ncbi:MAG: hypothetical protein AVDCRST_MAG15-722 [uncultured Rubellimicrobium sp.]|uniref:Uncharacterized protein n=1 Tax=uncultured Rubellimicrobium sp. TaxID=543078 RepID=A0A6J4NUS4_9RHOB|nr:MAG: hypothetical protein AVDCRST_MAG15-722 [uncultured Rubellimicrobium sp.]